MRRLKFLWLLACVAILLFQSGCAAWVASGRQFEPLPVSTAKATVYVYRPEHFFFAGRVPNLFIDGNDVGSLRDSGYLALEVTPGQRRFTLAAEGGGRSIWWPVQSLSVNLQAKAGQQHYLRLGISRDGFIYTPVFWASMDNYSFGVVREDIGRSEISVTKLSEPLGK